MPLPQLNTSGNDLTNTFQAISQINAQDAMTKTRKKQNALLDLQLSPEMQSALKSQRKADVASQNAITNQTRLQNQASAAGQIRDSLGNIDLGDLTGEKYRTFYDSIMANPLLKDHAEMLFDPDELLSTDISSSTGKTMTPANLKKLKLRIGNLMTAADRTANGLTVDYRKIHLSDGTTKLYAVPKVPQPGDVLDPKEISGDPGASFDKAEKEDKALKRVVGPDGSITYVKRSDAVGKEAPPTGMESLTKAQIAANKRANVKTMLDIDDDFLKADKEGNLPQIAIDKKAGQVKANIFNELAEATGSSDRLVWKEDAYEIELDTLGKIIKWGKDILPGEDTKVETTGGWVKEKIVKNLTEEQLAIYRKNYSGKTDEEIQNAYKTAVGSE